MRLLKSFEKLRRILELSPREPARLRRVLPLNFVFNVVPSPSVTQNLLDFPFFLPVHEDGERNWLLRSRPESFRRLNKWPKFRDVLSGVDSAWESLQLVCINVNASSDLVRSIESTVEFGRPLLACERPCAHPNSITWFIRFRRMTTGLLHLHRLSSLEETLMDMLEHFLDFCPRG